MAGTKQSPLHDTHKRHGARLIQFGGWRMPVAYAGIIAEHNAVRNAVGLFDVSHMGEFIARGPAAFELLQFITSNDLKQLEILEAQYSVMLSEKGTIVDDLLVYRLKAQEYMLVVNAANIDKDLEWIESNNSVQADIENVSSDIIMLAVQGPRSLDTLRPLIDRDISKMPYYSCAHLTIGGVTGVLSRTGYTGEDGFELYYRSDQPETIWQSIMESGQEHGIMPCGLGARNTLRLEAKMLLYGNDIDDTTTPLEAGLDWATKLKKGSFIGRKALTEQRAAGISKKLIGFEMIGQNIARDHYPIFINGEEVSQVTSGGPSITLKKNIGLAYLPITHTAKGTKLEIQIRKQLCPAVVVETPFYKRR